jgi:hypothetical protein
VETLSQGVQTAIDLTETVDGQTVELRRVSGVNYAKLPSAGGQQPWVVVTKSSSNPVIQQLASAFPQLEAESVTTQYEKVVQVATSVKYDGQDMINGQPVSHYTVVVDATKAQALNMASDATGTLPIQLWLDSQWRILRITDGGGSARGEADISSYDAPESISQPPSSQIQPS